MNLCLFLRARKFDCLRKFHNLCFCEATPSGVIVRPRISTPFVTKYHFVRKHFESLLLKHSRLSRKLLINCSGEVVAMLISSTFCAH